jgi:hypothetical protein
VRLFVLPVSPPGRDPRVRWIESNCARLSQPPGRRPVPYANFLCGPGAPRSASARTGVATAGNDR